jgi:hypothetical protein
MDKKYKALFVLEPTHNKVVGEAHLKGETIDQFLNLLLELWRQSQKKK